MSAEVVPILQRLDRHLAMFDLTKDTLGADLLEIASVGAHNALIAGEDVNGRPLAPLTTGYRVWKEREYPGLPIGFLELEMGRLDNFRGVQEIEETEATVTYGLNERAREELDWFCQGDPPNKPPRNVWGFTAASIRESTDRLDDHFYQNL